MYSQCPECLTRFRVTAAALRAARGTVRCGRCGSAFDALQRLTDAMPDDPEPSASSRSMLGGAIAAFDAPGLIAAGAAAAESGARDDSDAGAGTEFHFSADDIEQVFIDARDWQKRFPRAARPAPNGASSAHDEAGEGEDEREVAPGLDASLIPAAGAPVVFVHEPEAIEDITLEGERIVIEGLPEFDDELREVVDDVAQPRVDDDGGAHADAVALPDGQPPPVDPDPTDRFEVLREVPPVEPAPPQATPTRPEPPVAPVPEAPPIVPFRLRPRPEALEGATDDAADPEHGGRASAVAWGIGALALALALVGQLTHHFRQELARDARLGPVVRGIYARIGRPLAPDWDLAAFEVRQWGASEAAPGHDGAMTVRASLRNGASFAQPLPLLRLELEDRFGGTVARRDFAPAEYLDDPAQASRLLAPGARTEAELDVVAAGSDAVGYRLDVCLRDESGAARCAQSIPDGSRPR